MKRMRGSALLALALVAALGVLSCSKTNNHGAASNVYQSGCLEGIDQTNGWDETLTLDWNGQDLRLVHTNVCWNCGFKILVSQSVDAGVLDVQEANSGHTVDACDCLFEYKYTLNSILAGDYQFQMRIEDAADPIFDETINLPDGTKHYDFTRHDDGTCP